MTIKEKQIEKVKEILLKYLLSDALKPQYDGMTAYELAKIILKEAEFVEMDAMAKDMLEKQELHCDKLLDSEIIEDNEKELTDDERAEQVEPETNEEARLQAYNETGK